MRKVFLDELPTKEGWGANKGKKTIDWENSIGFIIPFIYDDIEGELEVCEYLKKEQKLLVGYKERQIWFTTGSITKCRIGSLLMRYTGEFIYKIGQRLKDEKKDIEIIDCEYRYLERIKNKKKCVERIKWYKCKCNMSCCKGYIYWIREKDLKKGYGCPCCSNKDVVLGVNTIWDTDRWMCDLGLSEQDAKTHTKGSGDKIIVTCPHCKKEKEVVICDLHRNQSIGCSCNGRSSYPELFMYNILKQLSVNFKCQLTKTTFSWCNNFRYDFYLCENNSIVETHGIQHYKEIKKFKRTLKEEQENDKYKEELAIKNGINQYIVIDCRKSELEWIKNSILDSKLNELYDLSKVNWDVAHKFAIKSNIVKEVCDYWNNKEDWETTKDLAEYFKKDRSSIISYLTKGTELGLCNYDSKEEMSRNGSRNGRVNEKKVAMFDSSGILIDVFNSAREIESISDERFGVKLINQAISDVCNKKYSSKTGLYKGYMFAFI